MQFSETKSVEIKDNTFIAHYAWIMGNDKSAKSTLIIGNHVQIGHFVHIIAKQHVKIEDSVLIADRVYISDCEHNYTNITLPILDQGIHIKNAVDIGEGSWIGENVCVVGAKIGKHCVIGANSVVIKNIPDYCIAAGIPAKVIKEYNFEKAQWQKK